VSFDRLERASLGGATILTVVLAVWSASSWKRLAVSDDAARGAVERLEARFDGRALASVEARLSEATDRWSTRERIPLAADVARPESSTEDESQGSFDVEEWRRKAATKPKATDTAAHRTAEARLKLITDHVTGLSKEQTTELGRILYESGMRERKTLDELREESRENLGPRYSRELRRLREERYRLFEQLLTPDQLRQLSEDVPLDLVPRPPKEDEPR
jgi:hypothetical protein